MSNYKRFLRPATIAALDAMHAAGNTTGTTPDDDLAVLAGLLAAAGARRILQLGTFLGGSALVLADLAEQAGLGARVVTVDPDPAMNENCRKLAQAAGLRHVIETVDGLSTDPALLARWRGQEWDAIYLDTTHQFDQTYSEIRALAPLCGPNTLFLFHDASQHAADTLDMGRQGGVKRAITEYALLNARWQYFIFERPAFGQFGIGLLQRKA